MSDNTTPEAPFLAWTILGGLVLSQLFFALTMAIYPGWPKVGEWLNSGNAANWAQAFMAFIAIFAGAGVIAWQVGRQAQLESDRQLAEQIRRLQSLNYGVFYLRLHIAILRSHFKANGKFAGGLPDIARAAERLRQVPLLDIPTPLAGHAIANCIAVAEQLRGKLENPTPLIDDYRGKRQFRMTEIEDAYAYVTDSQTSISNELDKLGGSDMAMEFEHDGHMYYLGKAPD